MAKEYIRILIETDEIYEWIKEIPYIFNSTIFQGVIVLNFPNRNTLDCVLEEILTGKFSSKIDWKSFIRTRLIVYHKEL